MLGLGVLENVVESFLNDVVELRLDVHGDPVLVHGAVHLEVGLHPAASFHRLQPRLQGARQAHLLQRGLVSAHSIRSRISRSASWAVSRTSRR